MKMNTRRRILTGIHNHSPRSVDAKLIRNKIEASKHGTVDMVFSTQHFGYWLQGCAWGFTADTGWGWGLEALGVGQGVWSHKQSGFDGVCKRSDFDGYKRFGVSSHLPFTGQSAIFILLIPDIFVQ